MKNSLTIKSKDNTQTIDLDNDLTQNLVLVAPRGIRSLKFTQEYLVPSNLELRNLPLLCERGSYSSYLYTGSYTATLDLGDQTVAIYLEDSHNRSSSLPLLTVSYTMNLDYLVNQLLLPSSEEGNGETIELRGVINLFESTMKKIETTYGHSTWVRCSEKDRTAQGLLAISKATGLSVDLVVDVFNQGASYSSSVSRGNISRKAKSASHMTSKYSLFDLLEKLELVKNELVVSPMYDSSISTPLSSALDQIPRQSCLIAV